MRILSIFLVLISFSFYSCAGESDTPKHVFIVIGDGTGYYQQQAGSLYLHGEDGQLTSQQFPVQLAMATYSAEGIGYDPDQAWDSFDYVKQKPTDSAAAATAMSTGVKTYNGAIGVDENKEPLTHLFTLAEAAGKATGVVTSVPFNHATPAGHIAHNESRNNYHELAHEMIFKSTADVIIGAGHPFYDADAKKLDKPDFKYISQDDWAALMSGEVGADADGDGAADPWQFVDNREMFQQLGAGEAPDRLLGIPRVASTLQVGRSGGDEAEFPFDTPLNIEVPRLAELTQTAINVLDNQENGFYLMIEAGAVDWACHGNNGPRMIEEVVDMENTVQVIVDWVEANSSWDETLLIVTADHETGYLTGPESGGNGEPEWNDLVNKGKGHRPEMEWHSGGHTNSLVPFQVKGMGAEKFQEITSDLDPVRGPYIDNTDLANILKSFFSN